MRVYVSTCDKYDHVLPGFAYLFNEYWYEPGQEVHVLGFREPPPLPSNFIFRQLEPVETKAWTTNLQRFFANERVPYFTWLLDDYWLCAPVQRRGVLQLEQEVIRGAAKGDLSTNTHIFEHTPYKDNLIEATVNARYRTSTQPAIWNRNYALTLLNHGLSPWEFERQRVPAVKQGVIVGTHHQLYKYVNVYKRGIVRRDNLTRLSEADRAALTAMGALSFTDIT